MIFLKKSLLTKKTQKKKENFVALIAHATLFERKSIKIDH